MMLISTAQAFSVQNPIGANNLGDIIDIVINNLRLLVIPVAVVMIVWAGFNFLTAAGDASKIKRGKDTLKWTAAGLAIIFIGSGFIDLIKSILGGGQ